MTEGFPGFAGILISCHRGDRTLVFHEVLILPMILIQSVL